MLENQSSALQQMTRKTIRPLRCLAALAVVGLPMATGAFLAERSIVASDLEEQEIITPRRTEPKEIPDLPIPSRAPAVKEPSSAGTV